MFLKLFDSFLFYTRLVLVVLLILALLALTLGPVFWYLLVNAKVLT